MTLKDIPVYAAIMTCEAEGLPSEMAPEEFALLSEALDFIEHYHAVHGCGRKVSSWRGKTMPTGMKVDVFAVSDPAIKAKIRALIEPEEAE